MLLAVVPALAQQGGNGPDVEQERTYEEQAGTLQEQIEQPATGPAGSQPIDVTEAGDTEDEAT